MITFFYLANVWIGSSHLLSNGLWFYFILFFQSFCFLRMQYDHLWQRSSILWYWQQAGDGLQRSVLLPRVQMWWENKIHDSRVPRMFCVIIFIILTLNALPRLLLSRVWSRSVPSCVGAQLQGGSVPGGGPGRKALLLLLSVRYDYTSQETHAHVMFFISCLLLLTP